MQSEWLKDLQASDLPAPYDGFAEKFGVEVALCIEDEFGGMAMYFPKIDRVMRKMRDRRIRAEFSGFNHQALARKYDLTERHVRNIVDRPDDKQIGMF